ncbi:MAG: DUF6502 family protein, partial [Gammaproteobacteria bacterium]|nr:DUF6502 family protein [Gammaproteobacteria bacterium]
MSQSALLSKATQPLHAALVNFAVKILCQLIRILLRFGLSYPEFNMLSRWCYVHVASTQKEFWMKGRQSKARVACITGLPRKVVDEMGQLASPTDAIPADKGNYAVRVHTAWLSDPNFLDDQGKPLVLPYRAPNAPSFASLSQTYCFDVPVRTILDELLRLRVVEEIDSGNLRVIDNLVDEQVNEAALWPNKGKDVIRAHTAWLSDSRFLNSKRKPLCLPYESAEKWSFTALVQDYCPYTPADIVLEEMIQSDIAEQTKDG